MPLSKEDLQRALSILESLIAQAESVEISEDQLSGNKDELLYNLQSMVDVLNSPLLSSLLEIKQQHKQRYQLHPSSLDLTNSSKTTALKLDSDPALLSQFRQTYGINDAEVHTNQPAVSSLAAEALADTSPSASALAPLHSLHSQFPTTFVRNQSHIKLTNDSRAIEINSKKSSSKSTKISGKELFNRRVATNRSGKVSLADLASSSPATGDRELRDASREQSTRLKSTVADSNESSLSSYPAHSFLLETTQEPMVTTDSVPKTTPFLKQALTKEVLQQKYVEEVPNVLSKCSIQTQKVHGDATCTKSSKEDEDTQREYVPREAIERPANVTDEDIDEPRDILFFMRDKKSQTELREGIKSREPRAVKIELPNSSKKVELGMDFAGVSSTGVFVKELYPGGLAQHSGKIQQGDQVLKVNQCDTVNMASFEVEMLIREVPPGGQITFLLKYNPVGWIEYQKLCQ